MTPLISLVALCGLVADVSRQPAWHTEYQAALAQGARQHRPLALFLAPGNFFELPGGVGLVLSDREGHNQAYCHEGDLEESELTQALEKHADPAGPVAITETNVVTQSYYGPAGISSPPIVIFQPGLAAGCSH